MPKKALYIFLFFFISQELYVFLGLKNGLANFSYKALFYTLNFAMTVISITAIVAVFTQYKKGLGKTIGWVNILLGFAVTFFATKFFFSLFLFVEDIYRIGDLITQFFTSNEVISFGDRKKFITNLALTASIIPLVIFTWGVLKGRYNFKVKKQKLTFDDLPSEFNGFKIVHFSDLHSGSFDSMKAMEKGVKLIQAQNPDIILFTGDLVNNLAYEFTPYISLFKQLKAPFGKFSSLGNHDYGLYVNWENEQEKLQNQKEIREHHKSIEFDLLNNTNRIITKNNQSIRLVGIENWGRPPFPSLGDLNKALYGVSKDEFIILLSHDPHHWDDVVLKQAKQIHLTLSGHTHGMQMGIDCGRFKWSPVKLRYKRWAGLYQEKKQYLYINRGFGHLGFPGRVGIMPEITVIELFRKK